MPNSLMRTRANQALCFVAIPAKRLEIIGEPKLDDACVPVVTRHLEPRWSACPRIATAIPFLVVDGQEHQFSFTTARARIAIVSDNNLAFLDLVLFTPVIQVFPTLRFTVFPLPLTPSFQVSFTNVLVGHSGLLAIDAQTSLSLLSKIPLTPFANRFSISHDSRVSPHFTENATGR
jgi:hypothetical protein